MAPLHKFNPVRLGYSRNKTAARFERDPKKLDCLKGLRILDIGCGAGILSEPLARMGAQVVGADPSAANIAAAKLHAEQAGFGIHHSANTSATLASGAAGFERLCAIGEVWDRDPSCL